MAVEIISTTDTPSGDLDNVAKITNSAYEYLEIELDPSYIVSDEDKMTVSLFIKASQACDIVIVPIGRLATFSVRTEWAQYTYIIDDLSTITDQNIRIYPLTNNTYYIYNFALTWGDTIVTRMETAESLIRQNSDNILLKVSESDITGNYIVGKINLNSTSAVIQAQHIDLEGAVTISSIDSAAKKSFIKSSTNKNQYYLSTSSSSATGGSWQDSVPQWSSGKYIWTRVATINTLLDNTTATTYSDAVYDRSLTDAQLASGSSIASTVSCYYRKNATAPSTPTSIGTAVDTDDVWSYVMPRPKKNRTFYTCERYTDVKGNVSYSTVREMSNLTYGSLWCSANDATCIDGGSIYANSITANQLAANSVTAEKINVTDLNAIDATIGGFKIENNSIHTNNVAVTSNASNSVALSSSTFTRTIGGTSRESLKFAIGANFAVNSSGAIYSSSGVIGGFTIESTNLRTAALDSTDNSAIALSSSTFSRKLGRSSTVTTNLKFAIGPNFAVNNTGKLFCTDAEITGVITATSGTIGGWTANSTYGLYSNSKTSRTSTNSGILINKNGNIYAGAYDSSTGYCPLEITSDGTIRALKGVIGGFITDATSFYSSSSGKTDYADGSILISTGNVSRRLVTPNGTSTYSVRLAIGSRFGVAADGHLYASDVTLGGNITATTGYIGNSSTGFTINSSSIYNGKSSLNNDNDGIYLGRDGIGVGCFYKAFGYSSKPTFSHYAGDFDGPAVYLTRDGVNSYTTNLSIYRGLTMYTYDATKGTTESGWTRTLYIGQENSADHTVTMRFPYPMNLYVYGENCTQGFMHLYSSNVATAVKSINNNNITAATCNVTRFGNIAMLDFSFTCTAAVTNAIIYTNVPTPYVMVRTVGVDANMSAWCRAWVTSDGELRVTTGSISGTKTIYGHLIYIMAV